MEGRHKRNVSDPSGAGVERDPYRVVVSFFTGPLNQTPVLPAQRWRDCSPIARDTMRLERPSSLRGLHWVFHFLAFCFFPSPGRTAGQSLVLRGAILVLFPRNGGLWPSSLSSPVTLASSIMTSFLSFSEHAPFSPASLHLFSPNPCLQASCSAPSFHRIPHLTGSHQPAPCSTICPSILDPFCLGLTGLN